MTAASSASELLFFTEHGSGSPLLLIHGLMVSSEMFSPVIEHFASRHRVIVPDLRGHGQSRALPPPYTVVQLAADLSRLLNHLGIRSAAVLGYSQGGAIAQQLVLDHPSQCDRLVLACTYAFNMTTSREKLEGHLFPLLVQLFGLPRMAKIVFSLGAKHLSRECASWLTGIMADQDQELMVTAWRAAMAFDSRNRLREIRCPTLVVAGSRDNAVPIHHAQMLHQGIVGSELVIVSGADHALIWTRPDELMRVVDAFLAD